jgi:membrane dipeptidase
MVDVSHSGKQTTLDILAHTKAPAIASHSAVEGIYDHPRNMSDEELDALKATGGVVQIVAFDIYLRQPPEEKTAALNALREEMGLNAPGGFQNMTDETREAYFVGVEEINAKWPKSSVSDLADHIDYVVKRIGIDHVGISSDFNGGGGIAGWENAAETLNVTVELVKRGYSEEDIAKLWGGNLLRVMEEVEAYAVNFKSE